MRILTDKYDLPRFFGDLSRAQSRLLLVDCGGTLAPRTADPSLVKPYPGVEELLNSVIERGKTRLVLMAGRTAENLASRLKLAKRPEIWGPRGLEPPGADSRVRPEIAQRALRALSLAAEWVRREDLLHRCVKRPGRLALNFRGMDLTLSRRAVDRAATFWQELADQSGLVLERTDGGLELRIPTENKADAIRALLSETDGSPMMAYLGDDLTDESAFRALDERGLGVLVRPKLRATSADVWIRPPDELLEFLRSWLRAEGIELEYSAAGGSRFY